MTIGPDQMLLASDRIKECVKEIAMFMDLNNQQIKQLERMFARDVGKVWAHQPVPRLRPQAQKQLEHQS